VTKPQEVQGVPECQDLGLLFTPLGFNRCVALRILAVLRSAS
jgi:hypothetical protein